MPGCRHLLPGSGRRSPLRATVPEVPRRSSALPHAWRPPKPSWSNMSACSRCVLHSSSSFPLYSRRLSTLAPPADGRAPDHLAGQQRRYRALRGGSRRRLLHFACALIRRVDRVPVRRSYPPRGLWGLVRGPLPGFVGCRLAASLRLGFGSQRSPALALRRLAGYGAPVRCHAAPSLGPRACAFGASTPSRLLTAACPPLRSPVCSPFPGRDASCAHACHRRRSYGDR